LATEGYKSAKSAKPETSDETLKTKKIKIDPADFESAEEGMAAENAVGGYVVTSGKFTRDAIAFAEGKNITLIDGNRLEEILDFTETIKTKDTNKESKVCPRCGSKLVERNGRKGKFSGCSSYPKCRYTEDLTSEK
jgi:hypothetical protein